ncbi:cellulose binding domain-containing protein, partial [Streptomyces glaucescens]|uniref:cellulose binding domain-containing protein n=1 Tax=Streptomyces glaucescens TaxID=1907 RepID=UPI003BB4C49A
MTSHDNRPAQRRRTRLRAVLATAAVTALGAAALAALPGTATAAGGLTVQYRTSASGASADQSEPWFKVRNTATTALPLSEVKVRYYFKADSPHAVYRFACSWAAKGCAHITGTFGTLAHPTDTADRYLEIGFTSGAGSLAPGTDTGDMQLRFYQSTWQPVRQSDDYSFGASQTAYGDWTKVTATRAGSLVWGTAPAGNNPTD